MKAVVQTKADVVRALSENRFRLQALGVRQVGLFGSFVRGDQNPGSDVDLLVQFEPGQKTFDNFMEVAFLLEDLFQRRVELVTPEALSPHVGPKILTEVEYVAPAD
jgi:predicted nucleotidyltransferase